MIRMDRSSPGSPLAVRSDSASAGVQCSYARPLTSVTLSTASNARAEATGISRHGNSGRGAGAVLSWC